MFESFPAGVGRTVEQSGRTVAGVGGQLSGQIPQGGKEQPQAGQENEQKPEGNALFLRREPGLKPLLQGVQVGFGGGIFPHGAADYFDQGFGLRFRETRRRQSLYRPVSIKDKGCHCYAA